MKREVISMSRLAEICGVSQGTVDRALNHRKGINPATKERILKVAKEYGYRPNIHARSMRDGRSSLIGIVIFDLDNSFFADLVSAIEDSLSEAGYHAIITLTHKDPKRELSCIEELYYMSVDGIILCPIGKGADYEKFLHSLDIPIVTVENRLDTIPYVCIDNRKAMFDTTRFVIERGYERLIYLMPSITDDCNTINFYAQDERLAGFKEACKESMTDYEIQYGDVSEASLSSHQKTALICSTDIYALRLFHTAKKHGCGIIGFDDLRIIDNTKIALDSVSQNAVAIAKATTEFLIHKKKPSAMVEHSITKRGSV